MKDVPNSSRLSITRLLTLAAGCAAMLIASLSVPQAEIVQPASAAEPRGQTAGAAASFSHFRVGQRNVKSIHVDGPVIWVGTSSGVIRYDRSADEYKLYDNRSGLVANGVFYVGEIDKRIAVGTYGGGLALWREDGRGWDHFNVPDGLGDAFVYSAIIDHAGDLWIATWSGANRVRGGVAGLRQPEQWELHTVRSTEGGLPNDWVYALAVAGDGTVWMATEGGLASWRDGTWQHWRHADGLGAPFDVVREDIRLFTDPAQFSDHHARQKVEMGLEDIEVAYNPNYVVSLVVDDAGGVWAGTWGGGLSHFDGRDWRTYTVRDGLPSNHVFALHRDPAGRLWIGTSEGLARFDGERFRIYGTADGLFAEAVFSIASVPDEDALWVGGFGGVALLRGLD